MIFSRASGILLHPTSLPGPFGIGSLGAEAYRFVDFLADAGQRLWQVLPLGSTGYGNSPYQSLSAFAGNQLLISLDRLVDEGLLDRARLAQAPSFPTHRVDYDGVIQSKFPLLEESFHLFEASAGKEQLDVFEAFCWQNGWWLDDYALFMVLRKAHHLVSWNLWAAAVRTRKPEALERCHQELAREVRCQKYLQFQFFKQWSALKRYCHAKGVKIIGDVAIYVAQDSADVWSRQDMYYLDDNGSPTVVAGVPPDYFSRTGQLWGNPIYRWDKMAKDGYQWWVQRLRATLGLVDVVRLDHFRGFEQYWEVPATETTAARGRWVPGPGAQLFEAIQRALGDVPIIAEDLGLITPEVHALRDRFGFPGMRVLQFAFGGNSKDNSHLPHSYSRNLVVYTGTHDNDTVVGWFRGDAQPQDSVLAGEAMEKERQLVIKYLGSAGKEANWDFIRLALSSVADTVIIPFQDVLGLGSEARMNRPGTSRGNWEWRFSSPMMTDEAANRLKDLTELYGR